jgi:hypothetical protein
LNCLKIQGFPAGCIGIVAQAADLLQLCLQLRSNQGTTKKQLGMPAAIAILAACASIEPRHIATNSG